jgi:hypothetical protein
LDGLNLDDSRILDEVAGLVPIPIKGNLGSLRGNFQIVDQRVSTADTILKIIDVPVKLAGWSGFDGRLDYLITCEKLGKVVDKLTRRLPSEARELLADLPMEELKSLADIKVTGTIDKPSVKPADGSLLSNRSAAKDPARRNSDKAKLKAAGRRLLDRVLR